MAEGIVLAVIERLSRQYPRVVFHVVPGGTLALCEELRARGIELGFVRGGSEEDIKQDVLVRRAAGRCGRHRQSMGSPPQDQAGGTGERALDLAVGWHGIRCTRRRGLSCSGLEPPRATGLCRCHQYADKAGGDRALSRGRPASIFRFPAKHPSIKVLPVELPTTHRPSGIITLKNRTLSPLAQLFIECAREVAKPLAKGQAPSGRARISRVPIPSPRDVGSVIVALSHGRVSLHVRSTSDCQNSSLRCEHAIIESD